MIRQFKGLAPLNCQVSSPARARQWAARSADVPEPAVVVVVGAAAGGVVTAMRAAGGVVAGVAAGGAGGLGEGRGPGVVVVAAKVHPEQRVVAAVREKRDAVRLRGDGQHTSAQIVAEEVVGHPRCWPLCPTGVSPEARDVALVVGHPLVLFLLNLAGRARARGEEALGAVGGRGRAGAGAEGGRCHLEQRVFG